MLCVPVDTLQGVMQVASVEEAWGLLCKGAQNRQSAETKMNDRSSRSHCMLCVRVRGQSRLTGQILTVDNAHSVVQTYQHKPSLCSLVSIAGSKWLEAVATALVSAQRTALT